MKITIYDSSRENKKYFRYECKTFSKAVDVNDKIDFPIKIKTQSIDWIFIYNKWILVQTRKLLRIYLTHNRIYFFIDIFCRRF